MSEDDNNENEPDEEVEDIIDFLIETGALELTSIDKNGDPVYRITSICKELFPDLYYEHMKNADDTSFALWQKGLLEISFADDGTNYITMSAENYLKYLDIADQLSEDEESLMFVLINKNILDSQ
jgi:hypothetical protein